MGNGIKELEKVLKALANGRRLAIVKFLRDSRTKEGTVGTIAEHIKLSFKSTSRHLSVLASAGIVTSEQRSLYMHYRINPAQHRASRNIISIL